MNYVWHKCGMDTGQIIFWKSYKCCVILLEITSDLSDVLLTGKLAIIDIHIS